jgi:hypothetical protein
MNRIISSLLVVAALAAPATAVADEVRFLVVNSVRSGPTNSYDRHKLLVLTGETVTGAMRREYRVHPNGEESGRFADCQRMALVAMNKPGKWFLDVVSSSSNEIASCTLVRNDSPPPP